MSSRWPTCSPTAAASGGGTAWLSAARGSFCINGFINHYPDFLAQTTDGVVLAIETKGGHLIGEDSEAKLRLGTRWADMAGREFRYVMVFESQKLDMANSLTLAEFSSGVLGC